MDAPIDDLLQFLPPHEFNVFPDAVKYHDRVVIRVTNQGQNGGNHGQGYLRVGERKCSDGDQSIVENSDYCCYAVNPLKTESQVNQHAGSRLDCCQSSLLAELSADLRPDDRDVA